MSEYFARFAKTLHFSLAEVGREMLNEVLGTAMCRVYDQGISDVRS